MTREGPSLSSLLHRLTGCPAIFLEEPRIGSLGRVDTAAVVADLIRDCTRDAGLSVNVDPWRSSDARSRNRQRLVQIACWLLSDSELIGMSGDAESFYRLLGGGLDKLAQIVEAEKFVSDEERREELVRYCLAFLELRPAGETPRQAEDRLATLNSVERQRILRDTEQARRRAEQIRQALKEKAAQEAAAKVARE